MIQDTVINAVAEVTGISKEQMIGKSRDRECVEARGFVMYILRIYFSFTLKKLGAIFGRNHTTIFYSIATVTDRLAVDRGFKRIYQDIREKLAENGYGLEEMEVWHEKAV